MLGLSVIILFKSLLHVFCSLVFSAHNTWPHNHWNLHLSHRCANPSSLLEAALLLFGKGGEVSDRGGCVTIGFRFDRDDKEDVFLQLYRDVGQMQMHHNHNQQRVPTRWDTSGASQPPSALCIAGKISARERSSAICPSAGQDGWYYDDFVEAGEDDRGDSDRYADEYNPIFIFRFYQLAECKEEASPVPGLKDQLEQRLAMKKNSQWFIQ